MSTEALIDTPSRLQDVADQWDGLQTYMDAPYGSSAWAVSCSETLTFGGRLFVPALRDASSVVAAAMLVRPTGRLAAIRQLGVEWHGEPGDFNYRDEEALRLLCEALAAHHVPLLLARVPTASATMRELERAYRRRGAFRTKPQPSCPYINVLDSADATLRTLPSRLRSDLRRAARRSRQYGEPCVQVHAPRTDDELAPIWEEAVRVEAAGWKGRNHSALAAGTPVAPFYEAYIRRASARGIARILFLRLGPETAAMMVAVETAERLWILKIGYDERFAKCSPGQLIMQEGLRYAADQGLRSYEFLGADTEWTRRWTDLGRPTTRVFAATPSPRGAGALLHETTGRVRRSLDHHLQEAS